MIYTNPYRPNSQYHESVEIDINNYLSKTHFKLTIENLDLKVRNNEYSWQEIFNLKVRIYFDYMSMKLDSQRKNGSCYDPKNLRDFEATVIQIESCATSSKVNESYSRILDCLQAVKNECRQVGKENIFPHLNQGFPDQQGIEECEKKLDTDVSVKNADSGKKTRKMAKCPPKAFTFAQKKFLDSTQSVRDWNQIYNTTYDLEAQRNINQIEILPS